MGEFVLTHAPLSEGLEGYCCAMCTELAGGKSRANFPPTPRFLTNILGRVKVLTFGVTKNTALLLRLKV